MLIFKNKKNIILFELGIFFSLSFILLVKKNNKKIRKKIAEERIKKLFVLAYNKALSYDFKLADRYVKLARKISMKYLVKIPVKYKRLFCKHCYSYILPDVTGRIRVKEGKIIIYCKKCKKFTRIPLK